MSRRILHLAFHAGEKTCASRPGTWCKFLYQPVRQKIGLCDGTYKCRVFDMVVNAGDPKTGKLHEEGWLLRLKECIAAEKAGRFTPGKKT